MHNTGKVEMLKCFESLVIVEIENLRVLKVTGIQRRENTSSGSTVNSICVLKVLGI